MKLRKSVKSAMKALEIKELRRNQLKPINSILDGHDTMVVAPTSFGKSLIYQIPAVVSDDLTVVIEPLLALMHDQADKLNQLHIPAACLDSTLTDKERSNLWEKLDHREVKILFLSPEQLEKGTLHSVALRNHIGIVVVDECHCVTMWGSTFRGGYLKIGKHLDKLPYHPTVVALSASVVPEDRETIMDSLGMVDAELYALPLYRRDLIFSKKRAGSRKESVKELLRQIKKHHRHTTIIFCNTVKAVEHTVRKLEEKYPGEVILYHGRNKRHEREMLAGEKHIIVATSALSLGVDLRNVDLVIHFNMPLSLAEYSQMAGRAGREGQKARSILIYNPDDYHTNYGLLQSIEDEDAKEQAIRRLDEMKEFCEDDDHCMVKRLLDALGDKHAKKCRYCSNCQKARRSV